MKEWALFKNNRNGLGEIFWTGEMTPSGRPGESVDVEKAFLVESKLLAERNALENKMDWWCVCNINDRLRERPEWKGKRSMSRPVGM